ncbi:hypothetical protein OIU76_030176 [Salix suchowensis]|nr:hypothetical protein OIU76_030176 [Salix suchowensis]
MFLSSMLLMDQEMELEQNKEEETQKSLPEEESPEEKVKLNEIEEMPETESTLLSIHPRLHPGMMCEMEMPKLIGKNIIWEDGIVSNKKDDEYGVSKEETHQKIEMERVALIEKHNVEDEVMSNKGEDGDQNTEPKIQHGMERAALIENNNNNLENEVVSSKRRGWR